MKKTKVVWGGAQPLPLIIVFLIGLVLWFIPYPQPSDPRGWHLLAIFVATVAGIVLRPLPMGAVALIGLAAVVATETLPIEKVLGAFGNDQIWLIVIACFIARGFIKTGLGRRIAYIFLYLFGRNSLGLSYGFLASDLLMAPAIPSSTARAGGILLPIIKSLSEMLGSSPEAGTSKKIGAFLTMTSFHGTIITTTMFLTAGAQNPVIAKLAAGYGVELTWGLWAKAAIVPALVSLLVIPLIIYKLYPPQIKNTTHAAAHAKEKLIEMGRISIHEGVMLFTFFLLLILWIFGKEIGIHPTGSAIIGLAILLITGVLTWKEILAEEVAWDSLIWFSVLVMMASNLNALGVIAWLGDAMIIQVRGLEWHHALLIMIVFYFYIHYFFASVTARVTSMYVPFLAVGLAVGSPPLFAALTLGYFSTLCGGLTHYGIGQGPVLYSMGYVDLKDWWKLGAILSFTYLVLWVTIGGLWWKWLGLW